MNKLANLQSALDVSSGRRGPQPSGAAPTTGPSEVAVPQKVVAITSSREGKENIAAWLPKEFKRSIRLVQAQRPNDPSLQELMAEAFNDLFIKYNVPTVSGE